MKSWRSHFNLTTCHDCKRQWISTSTPMCDCELYGALKASVDLTERRAECKRCKHRWIPFVEAPKNCPKCNAKRWWLESQGRGRPRLDGKPKKVRVAQ